MTVETRPPRENSQNPEIRETIAGVCALIVTPDGMFAAVQETKHSRVTNKVPGMISAPMETVKPGESYQQALERLLEEEVKVIGLGKPEAQTELCRVQLSPDVWVHAYLITVGERLPLRSGDDGETINPQWMSIDEIIKADPNERRFRPGMREIVESYLTLTHLQNGSTYEPSVYFVPQGSVPEEVFHQIEADSSQSISGSPTNPLQQSS